MQSDHARYSPQIDLCLSQSKEGQIRGKFNRPVRREKSAWVPVALAITAALAVCSLSTLTASAQLQPPSANVTPESPAVAAGLAGRPVEAIEIRGNQTVASGIIQNVVRTRIGQALDPATVQDDFQRIFGLRRFASVEAKLEPTPTGVVVVFLVVEERVIREIAFVGNTRFDVARLKQVIDIEPGQAVDNFRLAQAKRAISTLYLSKNHPNAHATVDTDALNKDGRLVFNVVEGPNTRIRNIDFVGNSAFGEFRLKDQIRSRSWVWLVRPGTLDTDQLVDDVASVREFYRSRGFFDARVGYKVINSADQSYAQVDFLVDEGPRYIIEKVTFTGNTRLNEQQFREKLRLVEGKPFDQEAVDRDLRRLVDLYSPFGLIYDPAQGDPDYLQIRPSPRFKLEPGKVELVYEISEGKPFNVGNIEVRGNTRTQQKVILRELRVAPGEKYDSTAVRRGVERLRSLPLFSSVKVTPIGSLADERDLLVEVEEAKTAILTFGAGVDSNGGLAGNVTFEQRNFDITNYPRRFGEIFTDKAFIGAGQTFRVSLEPGTQQTNASISWTDPYLFDQPYSFGIDLYFRDRERDVFNDRRLGTRVRIGRRFGDVWSASAGLRGELIDVNSVEDRPVRAFEILEREGNNTITSLSLAVRRDTTNPGAIKYQGTNTQVQWESVGVFGGDDTFQKFTGNFDWHTTLREDLTERRTTFSIYTEAGYIAGDAPFFERFYSGGIGSMRGFSFRGISPRSGPADDAVGGNFTATATAEVGFPLFAETLRGVVFTDVGTVESDFSFGTIRSSVGAGFRLTLPIFGQVPIAVDFAFPVSSDSRDEPQVISFSLGFIP